MFPVAAGPARFPPLLSGSRGGIHAGNTVSSLQDPGVSAVPAIPNLGLCGFLSFKTHLLCPVYSFPGGHDSGSASDSPSGVDLPTHSLMYWVV
jgi:hypothetical protein